MNKKSYVHPEIISIDLEIETTSMLVLSSFDEDDEIIGGTQDMPEEE